MNQNKRLKFNEKNITAIFENNTKLFIKVKSKDEYDNTICVVDKRTNKVDQILFTEFLLKYAQGCWIPGKKNDELKHYGTPQTRDGKGSGRYRKDWSESATKTLGKIEKAHAIGSELAANSPTVATTAAVIRASIASAVLSNPVVRKALNNPYVQAFLASPYATALLEKGLNAKAVINVRSERNKNRKGSPDKNGYYRLEKKETISDLIRNTNPYHGNALGNRNCWSCALAACLRQKGYDVTSKAIAMGVPSLVFWFTNKNAKDTTRILPAMGSFIDAKHIKERIAEAYGNPKNANGIITVRWAAGGGHAFNWTIQDGKVTLFDTQVQEQDLNFTNRYFNSVNHYTPIMLYRMDNAKLNESFINKLIEK